MKDKFIEAQAKVISQNEQGFTVGFACPDCPGGFMTTCWNSQDTENPAKIGDIVSVKVENIALVDGKVTEIKLFDGTAKVAPMPMVLAEAREQGIVTETTTKKPKYKVLLAVNDAIYKLEEIKTGEQLIGLSKGEKFEVDTQITEEQLQKVAPNTPMADFSLIHHWWGNGKYEHWDLFLNNGECINHFVLGASPLKDTEIKVAQRNPYADDFWLKGEQLENIPPGAPGNPSTTDECQVERLDKGKVAVYDSVLQANGEYLLRLEFFGTTLEGRWSFTSSIPNAWHALKETERLAEEQLPMKIRLSGDLSDFKETEDGLEVTGNALSFGVWNGLYWSPEAIINSPLNEIDNMIVDVEHDNSKQAGKILSKELDGATVKVRMQITDYETIQKIKNGEYQGLSIDATVFADPIRRTVANINHYKRLTVCKNPACKVCFIGA